MITCAVLLALLLFPPLDALENKILVARMFGDILMALYALLLGYSIDRYLARTNDGGGSSAGWGVFGASVRVNRATKGLFFGLLVPFLVLAYWNYPANFDATAVNVYTRYFSYFTVIVAAGLAGTAISYMSKLMRVGLLLLTFLSVGGMGSMMLVWQPGFYTVYSEAQNIQANSFLMMTGAFGELIAGGWSMKALDVV
jgi:hypothetical protein